MIETSRAAEKQILDSAPLAWDMDVITIDCLDATNCTCQPENLFAMARSLIQNTPDAKRVVIRPGLVIIFSCVSHLSSLTHGNL